MDISCILASDLKCYKRSGPREGGGFFRTKMLHIVI